MNTKEMKKSLLKRLQVLLKGACNSPEVSTIRISLAIIDQLEADKLEAECLLQDYQDLLKYHYGKNPMAMNAKGLYMNDLAEALGANAAKACERIYLETEKYFEKDKEIKK